MTDQFQVVGAHAIAMIGDPARDLTRTFSEVLIRWGGQKHHGEAGTGLARAQAAITLLDDALERLGERDRGGIKASLTSQRAEISRAIAALESLVGDPSFLLGMVNASDATQKRKLTGPLFRELVEATDQASASRRAADQKMFAALGSDSVREARHEIDVAEAEQRHVARQIDDALSAITYPSLPDQESFAAAKHSTEALLRLSPDKPRARSMHSALDSGLNAAPAEAKLWIIFETAEPHMLVDLRWRAFEERG